MLIIPAVDIKNGKCVRLYQGQADKETVYEENPVAAALRWQQEGATCLHLVDLDGAFRGEPQNLGVTREIVRELDIPVEFGGGLRDMGAVREAFTMGVERVILGTAAIETPGFAARAAAEFGERVFVGLDAKKGELAVEGWTRTVRLTARELVGSLESMGIGGIIYTDILRDGALTGPNFPALQEILTTTRLPVIASGGIASLDHIHRLASLEEGSLYGAIIGKALYTGDILLGDALATVRKTVREM